MPTQDYYQLLGLNRDALLADIKKAFRKLSLMYHPDKTDDKAHHELFLKINEAYEVLKSPETKRQYDRKLGVSAGGSTSARAPATNVHEYTYRRTTTTTTSGGYYGFYQSYYRREDDHLRQAEQEKARFERDRRKAFEAARLAEELLRKQQELKEQNMKEQMRRMKAQKEKLLEYLRQQEKQRREASAPNDNATTQDEEPVDSEPLRDYTSLRDAYERAKQAAYNRANRTLNVRAEDQFDRQYRQTQSTQSGRTQNQSYQERANTTHGTNSSDPIVLSDDDENGESFYSVHEDNGEQEVKNEHENVDSKNDNSKGDGKTPGNDADQPHTPERDQNRDHEEPTGDPVKPNTQEKDRAERLNNLVDPSIKIRPRQEPNFMRSRRSVSPRRPVHTEPRPKTNLNRTKRAKKDPFTFNGFQENLGVDIDDVDFSDMLNSLPNEGTRRKPSVSIANHSKRPKTTQYTNGTTKADTLHTPVNKNSVKGHPGGLTALDLHASPAILNCRPPEPPEATIDANIEENEWQQYVINIENYEKAFLQYKQIIVQYQVERTKRDADLFSEINTSPNNLKVYQESLQRDLKVQQDYVDQLRIYTNLMNIYQQNRNWISSTRRGDQW